MIKNNYIQRNLEESILHNLSEPEILAIVGPRQAGKSTLIHHLLKKQERVIKLSFDDRVVLNMFEKHTDEFIRTYIKGNKYLFIDEFQYAKEGGRILKYIYDTAHIKMIVTGSSSVDLTVNTVKYLVGRIFTLELFPFNFDEFLRAKESPYQNVYRECRKEILNKKTTHTLSDALHLEFMKLYEEYLLFGGYPRVVLHEDYEQKKEILRNIYNTYFLREVRDILGLIDDYKLQNLLKALALQIGNLIEYRELSRLSEFPYLALKKYINFLEKTYSCHFIRPFFTNKRKEILKNPKVYFFDTGLRNAVLQDFRKFRDRPDSGALLENGLVMEFIKSGKQIQFWRDKQKNEIDFVIDLGENRKMAIESKYFLKGETKSSKNFQKMYPEIPLYWSYLERYKKTIIHNMRPAYFW